MLSSQSQEREKNYFNTMAVLSLHTDVAQKLMSGTWQPGRLGLQQFAMAVSNLYKARQLDDPCAHFYLQQTHTAIEDACVFMQEVEQQLHVSLENIRGMTLAVWQNKTPLHKSIYLSNPLRKKSILLLTQVDYVIRQIITLRSIGLLPPAITTKSIYQRIQTVFSIPAQWRKTSTTRQDMLEESEKVKAAEQQMGELSLDLLHKSL